MTRRTATVLLLGLGLALAPTSMGAQEAAPADTLPEPGSELRVWLLTAGPGEAVWERFGHNAIRVLDTATGRDVAYNWGIFDFDQPGFIPRFLQGEMLYMMAPFQAGPMVDAYARTGRRIVMQELALAPTQRLELVAFAERNALPENRDYRYDYFRDNCSTRVRDLLDRVLGGTLSDRFSAQPSGTSWRDQIRRLTRDDVPLFTGMDVLLGTPGDEAISVWQEMFLPMTLRDALRDVTVPGPDGTARPLVIAEEVIVEGIHPTEPAEPPSWILAYLLAGLALGGLLAWGGGGSAWSRRAVGAVAALWSLAAGLVGTILLLVLFTDHVFMYPNANAFLLTPLSLGLALMIPLAGRRPEARGLAERLAVAVLAVAALALLVQGVPSLRQDNAIFLALVLPAHAGLWWGVRRRAREG